jgi:hypothetical protein
MMLLLLLLFRSPRYIWLFFLSIPFKCIPPQTASYKLAIRRFIAQTRVLRRQRPTVRLISIRFIFFFFFLLSVTHKRISHLRTIVRCAAVVERKNTYTRARGPIESCTHENPCLGKFIYVRCRRSRLGIAHVLRLLVDT